MPARGVAALRIARVQQTQRIAGNRAAQRMVQRIEATSVSRKPDSLPASTTESLWVQRDAANSPSALNNVQGDAAAQQVQVSSDASTQATELDNQGKAAAAPLQSQSTAQSAVLQSQATAQGAQLGQASATQGAALQNQVSAQGSRLNGESAAHAAALQQEANGTTNRLQGDVGALESTARATEASTQDALAADTTGLQGEADASTVAVQGQMTALETQTSSRVTSMTARTQALMDQKTALVKEYEGPGAHDPERFHQRWAALQGQIAPLEREQSNLDRAETSGESIGERAGTLWTSLTQRGQALLTRVSSVASNAWNAVQSRWSGLQGAAAAALAGLQSKASAAVNGLKTLATGAWTALQGAATQAWTGLQGMATGVWSGLQAGATAAWTALQGQATAAWTALQGVANSVVGNLASKISGIVNRISNAIGRIIDVITDAVGSVLSRLRSATASALDFLRRRATAAWTSAKSLGTRAWEGVKSIGTRAWQGAKDLGTRAWEGLKSLGSRAWQGLKDLGTRAWNGLKDLGQRAWNGLKAGWDWLKKKAESAWTWLKGAWETLKRKASQAWDWIKRKAKEALAWLKKKWAWLKALVAKALAWLKAKWKWLKSLVKIAIRIPDQTLCKLHNFKPWKFVDLHSGRLPIVKTVVDPGIGPVELTLFVQADAEATIGGTVGPCSLKNIAFTLQPLISRYTGQADFHVAATASEKLKLTGTIGGTANYGGLIGLAGGGLEGTGTANALGSFAAKPRFVYDSGKITTSVPIRLEFCLMPTVDLDAFVVAQLLAGKAPTAPAPPAPIFPGPIPSLPGPATPAPGLAHTVPATAGGASAAKPPPEKVLKEWKARWNLGSWSRRECWDAQARFTLVGGPAGLPEMDLQFSAKPVSLSEVIRSLFDKPLIGPGKGGGGPGPASKPPIRCEDLPDAYQFSDLDEALNELARLTGVDRKKLKPEGKRATGGPCSRSSGYETGMHYTVKNNSNGKVVGSIGMCPCGMPGGSTAQRYAILNYTDAAVVPVTPTIEAGPAYRHGGRTSRNLVPRPVDSTGLSCSETPAKGWTFSGGKGAITSEGFESQDDPTERDPLHFLVRPGSGHVANGWTMPSWQATRDVTTEDPATWHELTKRLRSIAS